MIRQTPIDTIDTDVIDAQQARDLVDQLLTGSMPWSSALLDFRFNDKSQDDWKIQVGQILTTAQRLGFDKALLRRLKRARSAPNAEIHPNDLAHRLLHQELAPAMGIHYLTRTGWDFSRWEPPSKTSRR